MGGWAVHKDPQRSEQLCRGLAPSSGLRIGKQRDVSLCLRVQHAVKCPVKWSSSSVSAPDNEVK